MRLAVDPKIATSGGRWREKIQVDVSDQLEG
jgi:hypothetical protein